MLRLSPDGRELDDLLPPRGRRFLLGITGSPGAGKSALAAALAAAHHAVVVPMDGFHLADVELVRRGLIDRKGAPETFDAEGYAALLARIRAHPPHVVMAPMFERDLEQPIAGAIPVTPEAGLVIAEGNYLLLDDAHWHGVRATLDAVWHVVTDEWLRLDRLKHRHIESGKSPETAEAWIARVDQPNAVRIEAARFRADRILDLSDWQGAF